MKGAARQQHRAAARKADARAHGVQARGRTGAGNRHRADAFERQAEQLASRVTRGEEGLGRHIALAPPAGFRPAGSSGQPLPRAVREAMEKALGADFAAVRVHSGGAADAAAREHEAEALTSGTNIYFREGRYAPHSGTGLHLLAHELTHVLQQTGRRDETGRLRAVNVTGSGEVQRKDDFVGRADRSGFFDKLPDWEKIKEAYKNIPDCDSHVIIIESYFPPMFPMSPDEVELLAGETVDPAFAALPNEIKGLYVDALKYVGGYEAARQVVVANPDIPTAFRSLPFYEHVRAESLGWTYKVAVAHPVLKDYYPGRFIAAYRRFLLLPGSEVIELDAGAAAKKAGSQTFEERLREAMTALHRTRPLTLNELQMAIVFAGWTLEADVRAYLPSQIESLRSEGKLSVVAAHQRLAETYMNASGGELAPSDEAEVRSLFLAILPDIRKAAGEAVKYWKNVAAKGADPSKFVAAIKADKRFKGLHGVLLKTATQIFERKKGELLGAKVFAGRVQTQRSALLGELRKYHSRINDLVRSATGDNDEAVLLGVVSTIVSNIEQRLARYDATHDAELSKRKRADERIAVRVRLARWILHYGLMFEWDDLRDAANDVFDEGVSLAFLGEWEPDPDATFGDLTKEAGGTLEDFDGTKISGALLDSYTYIAYFDALTKELGRVLSERGGDFSLREGSILGEGIDAAKALVTRPRRFIMQEWEEGDPRDARVPGVHSYPSPDFGFAVSRHPATEELRVREEKKDDYPLVPAEVPPTGTPVFLWFVPRIDAFVQRIAALPVVRDAVEAHWKTTHGKDSLVPDPATDFQGWMEALRALTVELNDPTGDVAKKQALLTAIGNAISGRIGTDLDTAQTAAMAKVREAVSHQRRAMVEGYYIPALTQYDRTNHRYWTVANDVFDSIRNFAQFVQPEEDQVLQVTALALELADALMGAFGPKESFLGTSTIRRHDIIDAGLVLTFEAVRAWDEAQKKAANQNLPSNEIAAISWLTQSELENRAETLRKLRDTLGASAEAEKRSHGLRGKAGTNTLSSVYWDEEGFTLIKWKMAYTTVNPDRAFSYRGREFRVVQVYETFTFHPGFGKGEALGVRWPEGSERPGRAQLLDASGSNWDPSGKRVLQMEETLATGEVKTYDILDHDFKGLRDLSGVLSEHLSFEYMKGAGNLIEAHVDLILDVLEFAPGVGPALSAARFVSSILRTIGSDEFREALSIFSEDGFKQISGIFGSLAKVVDLNELGNVLLFDTDFKESTKQHSSLKGKTSRQDKVAKRGGPWVRLAKFLGDLVHLGDRVLTRFKRVSKRVQTPVRDAQLWVLRTPTAVVLLDLVERGFDVLSSLSIEDLDAMAEELADIPTDAQGFRDYLTKEAKAAAIEVTRRGRDIMDSLRHLEMPYEILPVEWIIDFIIDIAVQMQKAKYRKPAEAVRGVLRSIGVWDDVIQAIKNGIFDAGLDPNQLYRNEVRDKLQPWLGTVRDEFAGKITDLLNGVPFLSGMTAPPGAAIELDLSGLGFEGYDADPESAGTRLPRPLPGGGAPLPRRERKRAEKTFGHDFGHVRLHTGPDAGRMTRGAGAAAVTSGSHVYLSPDVDPRGTTGQRILHHELAHVVQQTGARPLGGHFSDAPAAGRPGRGLLLDSARESAANRAADAVAGGRAADAPMAVGGAAQGMQPFTIEFLRDFLHHLHSDKSIRENREELEKEAAKITLTGDFKIVADLLAVALKAQIDKKTNFSAPFGSVHTELVKFIDTAVWAKFLQVLPLLIQRSVMTVTKTDADKKQTVNPYLPMDTLVVQLERELYGLTGMAFVVELNDVKGAKNIGFRRVVSTKRPLKSLKMVYVHLPLLPDNPDADKLWDLLTANSFQTPSTTAADLAAYKAAAKLVVHRGSPQPYTYDFYKFKFSKYRAKVVSNQRQRMLGYIAAPAGDWPTPADYANPDSSAVGKKITDIGLRVGDYDTWGVKATEDRDAHHPVQFLLLEYFHNEKPRKPFPMLGKHPYPGVTAVNTDKVATIKGGPGTIQAEKYAARRGGIMPTIFLARTTHQSGVHYRTEPPDDKVSPRKTQGSTIDNVYKRLLPKPVATVLDQPAMLDALEANRAAGNETELLPEPNPAVSYKSASDAFVAAARQTYQDMWRSLKPKLETALNTHEVAYYNSIAKLRGMPTTDKSIMAAPWAKIVADTEAGIGTGAGFGPA